MLNMLFGYNLANLNATRTNVEGIDLVDEKKRIIAQVSSTCTKQKIETSLAKEIFKQYNGYRFKFISISKNAGDRRKETFTNPHNALFDPLYDIIDNSTIQKIVISMKIDQQKLFYEFIKKELGEGIDIVRMDSNLATIISIWASENLVDPPDSPEVNSFEINRKIEFNDLSSVRDTIDEYKPYYSKVDEKYEEFDKQGANKSLSVLRAINNQYTKLLSKWIRS